MNQIRIQVYQYISSSKEYYFDEQIDLILQVVQVMEIEQAPRQRQQTNSRRQFLFMMVLYFILSTSGKIGSKQPTYSQQIQEALVSQQFIENQAVNILRKIQKFNLEAFWSSLKHPYQFLTEQSGKAFISIKKQLIHNQQTYILGIRLYNGFYVDEGSAIFRIYFTQKELKSQKNKESNRLTIKNTNPLFMTHNYEKLLINQNYNQSVIVKRLILNFYIDIYGKGSISLDIETDSPTVQPNDQGYFINLQAIGQVSRVFDYFIFSILFLVISFWEFSSLVLIITRVMQGFQQPQNYSLLTLTITLMWDCLACFIAFNAAFQTDENLILLIVSGFLFCILFTSLQLKLMMEVFRVMMGGLEIRQITNKFNILSYGCLLAIYPILRLTNFNDSLFIGCSLIFLPQILVNGMQSNRPDISSPYYTKFLLSRFALFLYIKAYPSNIFDIKPDFMLCLVCILNISVQFLILHIQKIWGPKKVIPGFLLPPLFNYACQIDFNVQQAAQITLVNTELRQCIICLVGINQEVVNDSGQQIKHRIMQTPCNHIYHGSCLVKWMKIKMECPTCRFKLPPYQ